MVTSPLVLMKSVNLLFSSTIKIVSGRALIMARFLSWLSSSSLVLCVTNSSRAAGRHKMRMVNTAPITAIMKERIRVENDLPMV